MYTHCHMQVYILVCMYKHICTCYNLFKRKKKCILTVRDRKGISQMLKLRGIK